MARLVHAAEFATEGERRTAEVLRELPDGWVVVANKTLVTRSGRSFEIDFLVLADHFVFAIDEKGLSPVKIPLANSGFPVRVRAA